MLRVKPVVYFCLAAILGCPGAAACAGQGKAPQMVDLDRKQVDGFDLARLCGLEQDCNTRVDLKLQRAADLHPVSPSRKAVSSGAKWAGPMVRYKPYSGGPSVEAAALGAGLNSAPGLVHLALNWDF